MVNENTFLTLTEYPHKTSAFSSFLYLPRHAKKQSYFWIIVVSDFGT